MMDDEAGGIFNIALSDSDSEQKPAKAARRTDQTEAEFQAVKATYSTKIENGDIAKSLTLPLGPDANKQHIQEAIHAVEELYFFQRFDEGICLVNKLLEEGDSTRGPFDSETRELLELYRSKCEKKEKEKPSTEGR